MFTTDKRTLAAILPAGTGVVNWITYPHGLGKTPDTVVVRGNAATVTAANQFNIVALFDASNVSLLNVGLVNSPPMEVSTIVFHSIIV